MANPKSALLRHYAEMKDSTQDEKTKSWAADRIEAVTTMSEKEAKDEAYALLGRGRPGNVQTTGMRR